MSEVTMLNGSVHYEGTRSRGDAQASPDSTRQVAREGGKVLPPSVSSSENDKSGERGAQKLDIEAVVSEMNQFIQSTQRDLQFTIDDELGETIVKVIDRQTEELIRQIPNEVLLKLARSLQEQQEPLHFFSEQA